MTTRSCATFSFRSFLLTQFCGALNDNIYKFAVSMIILNELADSGSGKTLYYLANALFLIPFVIISPYAGYLADRFSKSAIIKITKLFEVVVMFLAFSFLVQGHTAPLVIILFLMGVHSAIFSPCKYGILPEVLRKEDLSRGNGYVELWTYLAVLLGTLIGPRLTGFGEESRLYTGYVVVTIAIVGLLSSIAIPRVKHVAGKPTFNISPVLELVTDFKNIRATKPIFLTFMAIVYFYFIAISFNTNIILFAKLQLGLNETQTSILLTIFSLGVGLGSVFAGTISAGKVELGLVPIGAIGISLFFLLLGSFPNSYFISHLAIFLLGASAGVFIVPLNSFFQEQSPIEKRGRYLACLNVFCFGGMFIATALLNLFDQIIKLKPSDIYFLYGLLTIGATIFIVKTMPVMLIRCLNWMVTHLLYRVKVVGLENIPNTGGALIVCNHVTYSDPSLLLSTVNRPIRFLIYRPIYEHSLIKPFAKLFNCIPIAGRDDPKSMITALNTAREAIRNGELVCIFAEGALTRHGHMLSFKKGLERIMKDVEAPIVPVYLDQIWGSIFSFKDGKIIWKIPKEIPYPVTIAWGKAIAGNSKAWQVRLAVQELSSTLYNFRRTALRVLPTEFIRTARRYPRRIAAVDSNGKNLSYIKLLSLALYLSDKIKDQVEARKMVGILLPPSLAGMLANLSLLFLNKIPVNINYTASEESQQLTKGQCEIETVITSKKFLETLQKKNLEKMVYLEDLLNKIPWDVQIKYYLLARFLPYYFLIRYYLSIAVKPHDLATVIFSSGSTGEPKGVMLSHANILSNIEAMYDLFQMKKNDAVLGILPFFHSFGFTGTIWLPLLSGMKAIYHSNPMEAETIGKLARQHQATIVLATPTFLLNFIRKIPSEYFATLRHVIVGAEKLKESVAQAFQEKFGIVPLEGYGCTELSPIAIINVPDVKDLGEHQVGQKVGTVGHPLPGVAVRIIDRETGLPLAPGEEGLLQVKGPNLMLGYLNNPIKTHEVIQAGWYLTGDVATLDDDGFVKITDRLSRFSKIGGEMVPHLKVEEEILKALGTNDPVCIVTSVPDERKGEKLVVLHTIEIEVIALLKALSERGLPNLWIPKKESFFKIASLPLLGSGKLDLKRLKEIALDLSSGKETF